MHQLDLIVKKATQFVDDGGFYKVAHLFFVHLRVQVSLITRSGSKCPQRHHLMGRVRQNVGVETEALSSSTSTCAS